MMDCFEKFDREKTGIFAAGVLFSTAGIKLLTSKDARKVYTYCTAAVLRAKEYVMKTVDNVRENAEDIYEEAVQMNEERTAWEMSFEDESEDVSESVKTADAELEAAAE